MPSFPDLEQFKSLTATESDDQPRLIPMYRRLFSDTLTPVLAYRRLVKPDARHAPSFLLESVEGGEHAARYSFVGAQPVVADGRTQHLLHHDFAETDLWLVPRS